MARTSFQLDIGITLVTDITSNGTVTLQENEPGEDMDSFEITINGILVLSWDGNNVTSANNLGFDISANGVMIDLEIDPSPFGLQDIYAPFNVGIRMARAGYYEYNNTIRMYSFDSMGNTDGFIVHMIRENYDGDQRRYSAAMSVRNPITDEVNYPDESY